MAQVELADLITQVADQLREVQNRSASQENPVMVFDECELDLAIQVETGAKGGLKVWVVELGGERKKTDSHTVKVKFKRLGDVEIVAPAEELGDLEEGEVISDDSPVPSRSVNLEGRRQ